MLTVLAEGLEELQGGKKEGEDEICPVQVSLVTKNKTVEKYQLLLTFSSTPNRYL